MIGPFGLFHADPAQPADLDAMAARAAPELCAAVLPGKGAALGRLAHAADGGHGVCDETASGISAVASGTIYNASELCPQLGSGETDPARLVAALYRDDRLDELARANGQFCAALLDRGQHRVVLITDRLATFPIHLWQSDEEVAFASSIYLLLGDVRIGRRADPDALAQLFTMQRTIGTDTSIAGVRALPAATIASFTRDGRSDRQYWKLAWSNGRASAADYGAALNAAMRKAVGRAQSAGADGLLLSGGLDSRWLLAAARPDGLDCWTTASYPQNPELAIASDIAAMVGAQHHACIVDPPDTLTWLDDAVRDNGGLFPASTPFAAFMPEVARASSAVMSGHGIDYTLRGYYLPARFLRVGGSSTRLPALRAIPRRPTGADVLNNLRQGPPLSTLKRVVAPAWKDRWWSGLEAAMQNTLAPWLGSDQPYNAWDAFILHAVSKHYAFTGMMSVRARTNLHMPAFDNEIFDIYLQMQPSQRCAGRAVQLALRRTNPAMAHRPNANTDFPADRRPWLETASLLGRAALRRAGIARRVELPGSAHSAGSWQNIGLLYRDDPGHRAHFLDIRNRLDALTLGVLDADALAACIDGHLDGSLSHTKLLRQLLSHDAWVRLYAIEGNG